jgi:hypothetical protein
MRQRHHATPREEAREVGRVLPGAAAREERQSWLEPPGGEAGPRRVVRSVLRRAEKAADTLAGGWLGRWRCITTTRRHIRATQRASTTRPRVAAHCRPSRSASDGLPFARSHTMDGRLPDHPCWWSLAFMRVAARACAAMTLDELLALVGRVLVYGVGGPRLSPLSSTWL